MAETIKGISVLIEGDTTGLSNALSAVNKITRDTQSELKQVERLLKLDPTNVELLAQKQTLLTNAISSSRDKLDQLRAAQEQVNAQFARGEISEGAYRAFGREVAATEQQLARFESQLSGTSDNLNDLGDAAETNAEKLKSIGESVKGVGEKMSVAITAPIVAAGGLMLKGALDAENAQSKLQASLGITADEAQRLGNVATDVWKNAFGESIEEVDSAIIAVRKNMGELAGDELKKITESAMTIADVFGAEVTDSSKAAGVMMKNFGISGQDALDLITVGFQRGGDYSGELLDTLNEYAPQFSALGLTADQAMGILIEGAKAGAYSLDKVGDAMKEFNIRAQDGSDATAAGFKSIGLDATIMGTAIAQGGDDAQKAFSATVTALAAMDDIMAQNMAGTALFGTQWEDVRAKVIVAMADGVKGVGDFKGATDSAAKAMYDNNPAAALTSALRELQAAIGPALLPLAEIIKTTIVPAVKSMAEGFNELSPSGQKTALAIAGIAAAIGPLLLVIGPMISMVGGAVGAMGAVSAAATGGAVGVGVLTTAFPALGAALTVLTGPIGLTIAAIAGVVAVGALLVSTLNEEVIPAVDLFGSEVSDATQKTVGAYMDMDNKVGVSLLSFGANNTTITKSIADEMVGTFEKMGNDIKAGNDKHHAEDLQNLTKFYEDQGTLSLKDSVETIQRMEKTNAEQNAGITKYQAEIKAIFEKAAEEHRSITQKEADEIKEIQARMKAQAIQSLTESEKEQAAIFERMRLTANDLSDRQASEVIKNSARQRDETTKLANEQYEKVVASITRQRAEGVIQSDEQAKSMIDAAARTRDGAVTHAEDMHKQVVNELEKQNKDVRDKIRESDGEIKTWWDSLKDWFKNNPIIRFITTRSTTEGTLPNGEIDNNASGTSYFDGGLTTMHEDGYEVYSLPRGTKIYNHAASEDMVLKMAQELARISAQGTTFTGPMYVTIPAKDLAEMRSVQDFFNTFQQVARAGG